jgi:hypothetical protein
MGGKIMSELKKHILENQLTLPYLHENLNGINSLSEAVLQYVDFNKGYFFTFLKKEVPLEQLYQFSWGGVGGSIRKQISDIVLEKMEKDCSLICIFDDVGATYKEPYNDSLFTRVGLYFNEEVYYLITNKNKAKDILDICFYASGGGWHSLCLLSKYSGDLHKRQNLTESDICSLAKMSSYIILEAYDGESFVFWEKTNV